MKTHYLIIIFFVLTATLAADERPVLRIGGSDLFDEAFHQALKRFAEEEGIELDLNLKGSYAARTDLESDRLDLAMLAVPGHSEDLLYGYESFAIAYQTVVFGIHPDNPLNELTLPQIAAIFGAEELSSYSRWGEVGLRGELGTRSISLYSIAPGRSIAVDLFRHEVLRSPRLRGTVTYVDSTDGLLSSVQESRSTIALLPRVPPPESPVRALALATERGEIAFGPTRENVHNGDYPIRLPVYVVFPDTSTELVRNLLIFLTREEVADAVEAGGLTPLPGSARNRLRFDFEQL